MNVSSTRPPVVPPSLSTASQSLPTCDSALLTGISFAREVFTQPPAKILGLTALWASHYAWGSKQEPAVVGLVISAGLFAGLLMGWKLAGREFGTDTTSGKFASGVSAAAVGIAVAAVAVGSEPAAVAVEVSVAITALGLVAARLHARRAHHDVTAGVKAAIVSTAVVLTVAAFCVAAAQWPDELNAVRTGGSADGFLIARQCGAIVEALVVESAKEVMSSCGPSADPKALTLEARLAAQAKAWLPYVGSCLAVNGVIAPALLPKDDGVSSAISFEAMLAAVLVTCFTNMFRNGLNTAAVLDEWPTGKRPDVPFDPREYVSPPKTMSQRLTSIGERCAVRYCLMAARTTTYVFLRLHGFSVTQAALVAQGKYAVFNQFREVASGLMNGDSWTPETPAELTAHEGDSRIDLDDVEAQFDAEETEREYQKAMQDAKRTGVELSVMAH